MIASCSFVFGRYIRYGVDGQIDRYGVDTEKAVDKISRQLLEHNVITEGYGGQVPIVPVRHVC